VKIFPEQIVSQPFKTTDKIIVCYDLIFSDIGIEQGDINFVTELASVF
jgi:hypothetical protein